MNKYLEESLKLHSKIKLTANRDHFLSDTLLNYFELFDNDRFSEYV